MPGEPSLTRVHFAISEMKMFFVSVTYGTWLVVVDGGSSGGHFDYLTRPASNAEIVRVYPLYIWISVCEKYQNIFLT